MGLVSQNVSANLKSVVSFVYRTYHVIPVVTMLCYLSGLLNGGVRLQKSRDVFT